MLLALLDSTIHLVTRPSGPANRPDDSACPINERTRSSSAGSAANSTRTRNVSSPSGDASV